jgi:hypothetical protein
VARQLGTAWQSETPPARLLHNAETSRQQTIHACVPTDSSGVDIFSLAVI